MFTVGVAVGLEQLVQLKPPDGAHEYVPPPLEVSNTLSPRFIVVDVPATATGDGLTVIVVVVELLPFALEAVSVTVYVPGPLKQTCPGFCNDDVGGVPFGKVQVQAVGELVLASVNKIQLPSQILVAED